jgi:hypothetical protein
MFADMRAKSLEDDPKTVFKAALKNRARKAAPV